MHSLIDIGANLSHSSFANDLSAVLARAQAQGVRQIIVTGASIEGSVLKGHVVRIDDDFVLVDVGLKSEGRIPLKEFARGGGYWWRVCGCGGCDTRGAAG